MNKVQAISFDKQIYYRLIALWVLCEGFVGGIIHGLKIPISGLVVGSGAVICICFIAYYVPVKGAIIKATIIVAIFKMMLSPHSPPTAYIAVFFQGCLGQLLFLNLNFYKVSCLILGLLSMVESAVQRVLVLIILYGTDFWNAVDQFIMRLTNQKELTNYSLLIATSYILLHAVVGLMVGSFAIYLVSKSKRWKIDKRLMVDDVSASGELQKSKSSSRKKFIKNSFLAIWIALILLFLQSTFNIGTPLLPAHLSLQILLRSLLIILTWYFLISPVAMRLMKKWLEGEQSKMRQDIQQVLLILPATKNLVYKSWQIAEGDTRWSRIRNCLKIILINTLYGSGR